MNILYKDIKKFNMNDLEQLFLSVNWSSAQYPEKLVKAIENSDTVFSAWNDKKLVGLINVLDDSVMTAYVHYLLVNPEYQGFKIGKELIEMVKYKYKDYLRIVLNSYKKGIGFYQSCGFKVGEDETTMFLTSLWD